MTNRIALLLALLSSDLIVAVGSPNPFVNWTFNPGTVNPRPGDFHLVGPNPNWDSGTSLPPPFNVDPDGRPRNTWNRGAFE